MRVGQIARKLSMSPSEIVGYLATRNIVIEENANSRLETDHVRLILQKFAPDQLSMLDAQPVPAPVIEVIVEQPQPEPVVSTENEELINLIEPVADHQAESNIEAESSPLTSTEIPEVIKAQKVALSGLKVLGKIELPEHKKKEQEAPVGELDSSINQVVKEEEPRRSPQPRRQLREQRPYKNPVAQQREREMKEELQKREEKAELEKERRTQNYLKKVKMSPPTKAVRMVDEPLEQMTHEELKEEPKSFFGKFIKWLST